MSDYIQSNTWPCILIIVMVTILTIYLINKFSQVPWKIVDLAALSFGAFALLVPIFDADKQKYKIESENYKGWTNGELSHLQIVTSTMLINCNNFVRSEWSPPDFDTLVLEQKLVCDWARSLTTFVETLSPKNYTKIPISYFQSFPEVREVPVGYKKDAFIEYMNEWNSFVETRRDIDQKAQASTPIILVIFAPYLLAFSFALAMSGALFKPRPS